MIQIEVTEHADRPSCVGIGKWVLECTLKPFSWQDCVKDLEKKKLKPLSRTALTFLHSQGHLKGFEHQVFWSDLVENVPNQAYTFNARHGFVCHTTVQHHLRMIGIRRMV